MKGKKLMSKKKELEKNLKKVNLMWRIVRDFVHVHNWNKNNAMEGRKYYEAMWQMMLESTRQQTVVTEVLE